MQKYQNAIQDVKGNAVAGATVSVYLYGTTAPATIYSDNGVTPIVGNTVTTNSNGEFFFYAANGNYTLIVTATNFTPETYSDVTLFDPEGAESFTTEVISATSNQTVFTLTNPYSPGTNTLTVFVNGALQIGSVDYHETNSTTVTFTQGAVAGSDVVFQVWMYKSTGVTSSNNVSYASAGTGAVLTTVQTKLRDTVSVKDFGAVGDGVTNDTAAIQAALTYVQTTNGKLCFPPGIYVVSSTLTLTGNSAAATGKSVILEGDGYLADASPAQTIIKWNGTSNSSNILFNANGVGKLVVRGIGFHGNNSVGTIFQATQSGTTYAPFGWGFDDVGFFNTTASGKCFSILTTTNMARFGFNRCVFTSSNATSWGFYTANQNAVSHTFTNCSFDLNGYGIGLDGGSFTATRCEFTRNAIVDVNLTVHNPVDFIGCWFEQSNKVLVGDYRTNFYGVTFIGCIIASYPWSYWKLNEAGRTQPTNDYTQWISIQWDGPRGPLALIDTTFVDPFNGAATGSVSPTTSSLITVNAPNGFGTSPSSFSSIGSQSQSAANTFTEQFFYSATSVVAALVGAKRNYFSLGNFSGPGSINPAWYSTFALTATGNLTLTLQTTGQRVGDKFTLQVTQDGTGGRTVAFVNAKVAGGSWTPTSTANAVSNITFEFSGTFWYEISRSLNLS